ncbi:YbaK/EbsC family protein [Dokdonella soli]|uniref:YbaK/EbsC family protein n=1 Tax=Dokdonella soli TaxID=529810 RepID=A0ABN1IWF1_9GAMM
MPEPRLHDYLNRNHITFDTIQHARTITAQETAASAHIHGHELAKTVMVKLDDRIAMVVLPASQRLHFGRLKKATGANTAGLADESEFRDLFPGCEPGAMSPFGNLYGLDVYVEDSLAEDRTIAFNAGTHTELVRMPFAEFERLVNPRRLHRVHRLGAPDDDMDSH